MERLKYGTSQFLTKEERLQRKRDLQKHWRANHPDWVKKSNKYWSAVYRETKPFISLCCVCGKPIPSVRKMVVKYCNHCRADKHNKIVADMEAKNQRRTKRLKDYQEIIRLHEQGLQQSVIAERFNRSQSGISAILRKYLTFVKHAKKRCLKKQ